MTVGISAIRARRSPGRNRGEQLAAGTTSDAHHVLPGHRGSQQPLALLNGTRSRVC